MQGVRIDYILRRICPPLEKLLLSIIAQNVDGGNVEKHDKLHPQLEALFVRTNLIRAGALPSDYKAL